jgi:hypothetical protein
LVPRVIRAAGVTLLACVLAVVLTYPLAFKLDRVGRVNTGDGLFSLWCVTWVAHELTTYPQGLYHGNIFYPHSNTLAYSEANVVAGVLGVPAYLASRGNPFTTHNSVVLMAFTFSLLAAYALARYLTGSTAAAIAAGIAFAYCPFIFARLAHMQLLMTFGLPLSLLALHRLVDRLTVPRALALAGALVVQALACAYYGIFAALIVGLGVLYYAIVRPGLRRSARYWTLVAVAAVVSIGAIVPFFLPFLAVQEDFGFARTLEDASMFSADWQAWLASSAHGHAWLRTLLGHWNEVLFPGIITTALGVTGACIGLRRSRGPDVEDEPQRITAGFGDNRRRETTVFYLLFGAVAFWASFGPSAGLYRWFYDIIPVFTFLRAPARFGIVVALVLSVLLAVAMAHFMSGRARREQWIMGGLVAALLACELATIPLDLREAPPVVTAYRLLAKLPRGPVLELPFYYRRSDFPRHAEYMLGSTYHWQPLINGYSDHIPEDFRKIALPLSSFPTMESFALIEQRKVRYVVFHTHGYDRRSLQLVGERLAAYHAYLRAVYVDKEAWLYEIVDWPKVE